MFLCPNCGMESFGEKEAVCVSCGWSLFVEEGVLNYLANHERESDLSRRYAENYESLAIKNLESSNISQRFLKNQAKNLAKYVGDLATGFICDVGIGQGFLCDELLRAGAQHVWAVDISRSYLKRFVENPRVSSVLANAENLPFKNHFDLVVSTDVMEHVLNVGSFLFSVNRALKIGGVAAIRVPYKEPLLNYSPKLGYSHTFGHLRSFDRAILKLYMEQAGFTVSKFHLDGFSPGTPQPYFYNSDRRKALYHRLLHVMNKYLEDPADATLWNSRLARLIMRPAEIVVVAKKVKSIQD